MRWKALYAPRSHFDRADPFSLKIVSSTSRTIRVAGRQRLAAQAGRGFHRDHRFTRHVVRRRRARSVGSDPAVHARSDRYAASTRVVCGVHVQQAKQMTTPAPLVYKNLTEIYGLTTQDPAWEALISPARVTISASRLSSEASCTPWTQTRTLFPTTRAST